MNVHPCPGTRAFRFDIKPLIGYCTVQIGDKGQPVPSAVLLRVWNAGGRKVVGGNFEFSVAGPQKQVPSQVYLKP